MIETPEPPHAHKHSGINWLDLALALSVLVISVGSLMVARHTSHTMEALVEQNARLVKANATPWVLASQGNARGSPLRGSVHMEIVNNGTGPAKVVWVELRYNGKVIGNLRPVVDAVRAPGARMVIETNDAAPAVLKPGEERSLFAWDRPAPGDAATLASWQKFDEARGALAIEGCYCSLLGECWQGDLRQLEPTPVPRCDAKGRTSYSGSF